MADYDAIDSPSYQTDKPFTVEHPSQDLNVADDTLAASGMSTGDLRRKYNFGNTFTTLSAKRDPFLHLLNRIKGGKVATDDPKFKFTTKRMCGPQHRYGYVVDADEIGTPLANQAAFVSHSFASSLTTGAFGSAGVIAAGDQLVLKVAGDYLYAGNKRNKYGQETGKITLLADDTAPRSFVKNQMVRVPMKAAAADSGSNDYLLAKVNLEPIYETDYKYVYVPVVVVKTVDTATNLTVSTQLSTGMLSETYNMTPTELEPLRIHPVGSAYKELSGYGQGWKDQPWSTDYGYTQIFKTTMMMSNRAQATTLKFEPSEWRRIWGSKLQEHAWDIAQAGYFGKLDEDSDGITYTQGAVDYILNNGNRFTWANTYTVDDFMNDMSTYKDPRTDMGGQVAYFCNSEVWNWMQKMGGFLKNNSEISTNYEFQLSGRGIAKGVPFSKISTAYGDLNLIRDVHLDGTNVKIMAINLNAARYRPLIGNGVNRDTTVYVGVKTIENSGDDYRVDLIQTDCGFEFSQPETHAIWL
tara:strand:+ start:6042 stop:7613 length:1572 start_codon:yes stop_codon:yes gene_type:complete